MSPPRSASANARTRIISVTACRPRGSSRTWSRVASRSARRPEPRRRPRCSRRAAARTGCLRASAGRRSARRARAARSGSGERLDLEGAAVDAAARDRPRRTPTPADPGFRTARRWRRARRVARRARGRAASSAKPATSPSASATATSNAALDDRPPPIGTVDVDLEVGADRRAAELGEHAHDARRPRDPTRAAPRRGSSLAVGRDVDDPVEIVRARDDPPVGARARSRRRRRGRSPSRRPSPRGSRPGRRSG